MLMLLFSIFFRWILLMVNRSHTLEVSCPQNYGLCLADTLIPCNINYFALKVSWHPIRFDNI